MVTNGEYAEPDGHTPRSGWAARLHANALLGLAYFVAGWLSLLLAVPPGYASPMFPPAGMALGAVLVLGLRVLPGVFCGSLLVNLLQGYHVSGMVQPLPAAAVALAATLQAGLGARLVRRWLGAVLGLEEPLDVIRFVLATVGGCLIAASLAVPALVALGIIPAAESLFSWWNWWMGDAVGAICFAPLTLLVLSLRRPEDVWSGRRLAVSVPIVVALVALILVFLQFNEWERIRVDRALERDTALLQRRLSDSVQAPVDVLDGMHQFIENSIEVTPDELARFVEPWLARDTALLALGRAEHVGADGLPALRARQRAAGFSDFRVVERDAAGGRREADPAERRERLVITSVEPRDTNQRALGLDILSVGTAREAALRASGSGRAAATSPFQLAQQPRPEQRGIVVYLSYGHAATGAGTGDQRGGVVFAAISFDTLGERLGAVTPAGLTLCVSDATAPVPVRIAGAAGCERLNDGPFVAHVALPVADRSWVLRVAATRAYIAAQSGVLRWYAPAFGLTGLVLLVAFVLTSAGRTRRIESLVARRTAELSAAQHRYADLVNSLDGVVWEAERGARGVVFISERVQALLGYAPAECLGPDFWLRCVHPDDRETARQQLRDAMNSNRASFELEFRALTADGRVLWLQHSVTRLPSAQGLTLLRGVTFDISERHAVSERLALSERRLRAIATAAAAYLYEIDNDGVIRFLNRTYYGRREADVVGTPLTGWFPPGVREQIAACLDEVRRTGESRSLEYALADGQGGAHDFLAEFNPVRQGGETLAVVMSASDVSGLKRVEARLRASERRFSEMLANVKLAAVQLDLQGRVTFCNDYLLGLIGRRSDETIGEDWFEIALPAAARAETREVLVGLLAEGREVEQHENEICSRDGECRLIAWNNTLLRDVDGHVIGVASIGEDVTVRHRAELERERAWALLQAAIAQSPAGILIVDAPDMRLRIANPAAIHLRGMAPGSDEASARRFMQGWEVFRPDGSRCDMDDWPLALALRDGTTVESAELIVRDAEGRDRWVAVNAAPVRAGDGALIAAIVVFNDVTLLKEQQQRLAHLAHYDALTRLPNRVLLADRLQLALQQAARAGTMLAVAYLDLDGFKAVNDRLGHEAGDDLLIEVSGRLRGVLRGGDSVARIGGDEFVLLLHSLAEFNECEQALRRVLAEVAAPYVLEGERVEISASIGVTVYPTDGSDADALLRHADQAMYVAKQAGRNRYHLFDAELDRRGREERAWIGRIGDAIATGELMLYFQPRVDLRSGQVVSVEALVRWRHPQRGLLLPAEFLPQIEDHPLSITLGEWVITEALRCAAGWYACGVTLTVSVNIAARHLQSPGLMGFIERTLQTHPELPQRVLELEILETAAIEDLQHVSRVIEACQQLGVGAAIDDFGTGYSSLSYFKRLPAEVIKIDQSFIRDMLHDPEDLAIVEGVIGLTRVFRRTVVAEGVETEQHGLILIALGCDQAQGYAIAQPMPGDELLPWLGRYRPYPSWGASVPVLAREDVALLGAEVEHFQWIERIRGVVEAGVPDVPVPRIDAAQCRFGRWLAQEGDRHGDAAKQIDTQHDALHALAEIVAEQHAAGETQAARANIARLLAMRDTLFRYVRQLLGIV